MRIATERLRIRFFELGDWPAFKRIVLLDYIAKVRRVKKFTGGSFEKST